MQLFNSIDSLGLFAGSLTTIAFFPQIIKTYKSKSAEDVSYAMFILFSFGVLLWSIYGWEIHSIPVIISNVITLLLAISVMVMKLIFSE